MFKQNLKRCRGKIHLKKVLVTMFFLTKYLEEKKFLDGEAEKFK